MSASKLDVSGWQAIEVQILKSSFMYDVVGHDNCYRLPVYQLLANWLRRDVAILYAYVPDTFKGFDEYGKPIFGECNFESLQGEWEYNEDGFCRFKSLHVADDEPVNEDVDEEVEDLDETEEDVEK